jgi:hypothetical protein
MVKGITAKISSTFIGIKPEIDVECLICSTSNIASGQSEKIPTIARNNLEPVVSRITVEGFSDSVLIDFLSNVGASLEDVIQLHL